MEIHELLAQLQELAARAKQGEDVNTDTLRVARQLREEHNVDGNRLQRAHPAGTPEGDL